MQGAAYTLLLGMAPAPAPLVEAVQEITVDCSVEEASVLRVRFGITKSVIGDWSILQFDPFRPLLPLGLRIQHGIGVPEAVINGFVSDHRVTYADDPGGSSLEVTAMDATHVMNMIEKVMPWPNMPDAAIASAIFGQYALIPQVDPTTPVLIEPEGQTTQRGTDIRFLRRLARRNGFDCYVQPEPFSGLDIGHFHKRELLGMPQAVLSVSFGGDTNVSNFNVRYEATKPTAAIAVQLDTLTKTPQPGPAPVVAAAAARPRADAAARGAAGDRAAGRHRRRARRRPAGRRAGRSSTARRGRSPARASSAPTSACCAPAASSPSAAPAACTTATGT